MIHAGAETNIQPGADTRERERGTKTEDIHVLRQAGLASALSSITRYK